MKEPQATPAIYFKNISPEDTGTLSRMALEIWQGYYLPEQILSADELNSLWNRAYREDILRAHMASGACYEWIMAGQQRAGFLAYRHKSESRCVHLSKLYLWPDYRNQGIGLLALEHIVSCARRFKADEIYLYVFRKNHRAIRTYQKAGFIISREEKTWTPEGYCYDDYVMSKLIASPD